MCGFDTGTVFGILEGFVLSCSDCLLLSKVARATANQQASSLQHSVWKLRNIWVRFDDVSEIKSTFSVSIQRSVAWSQFCPRKSNAPLNKVLSSENACGGCVSHKMHSSMQTRDFVKFKPECFFLRGQFAFF